MYIYIYILYIILCIYIYILYIYIYIYAPHRLEASIGEGWGRGRREFWIHFRKSKITSLTTKRLKHVYFESRPRQAVTGGVLDEHHPVHNSCRSCTLSHTHFDHHPNICKEQAQLAHTHTHKHTHTHTNSRTPLTDARDYYKIHADPA